MPSPFGVKGPKVGSCIVADGIPVARGSIGTDQITVLQGSRKKVVAEICDE
jgi:hypothetical protein